jgi:hypothetical protein
MIALGSVKGGMEMVWKLNVKSVRSSGADSPRSVVRGRMAGSTKLAQYLQGHCNRAELVHARLHRRMAVYRGHTEDVHIAKLNYGSHSAVASALVQRVVLR